MTKHFFKPVHKVPPGLYKLSASGGKAPLAGKNLSVFNTSAFGAGHPWPARACFDYAMFHMAQFWHRLFVFSFCLSLALPVAAMAAAPAAPQKETLKLDILTAPVTVLVDKWGIPHIEGKNELDVFRVVGWLQARDRWLMLEFARRNALGTLSELGGPKMLEHDKNQRKTLLWQMAQYQVDTAQPRAKAGLEAFSQGVNAWLKSKNFRPHKLYTMAVTKAEPWKPLDTAAIGAFMAWALSANHGDDYMIEKAAKMVGEENGEKLLQILLDTLKSPGALRRKDITDPILLGPKPKTSLSPTEKTGSKNLTKKPAAAEMAFLESSRQRALNVGGIFPIQTGQAGSNNWVFHGKLTKSGGPIVAGDTHMGLMSPAIWWEAQLKAPEIQTHGVFFPGSPMPIIGFTPNVAWSATVLNPNATDVWKEKLSDDLKSYWFNGKWVPLQVIESPIWVNNIGAKKKEPFQIFLTHRGPITDINAETKEAHSFRWTGHLPIGNIINAAAGFNIAKNATEFDEALREFHAGGQNFVFADRLGNIGYRSGTKSPLRKPGWRGIRVGDGTTDAHDWTGEYVPFEEMPHTMNPKDGFIITANSATMDPDTGYKYEINPFIMHPYRVKRGWQMVNAWKAKKHKITVQDNMSMQMDNRHNVAAMLNPTLLGLLKNEKLDAHEKKAVALLKSWDYHATKTSSAATIFTAWWQKSINEIIGKPLLGDNEMGHPKNNTLSPVLNLLLLGKAPMLWGDDALKKLGPRKKAIEIFHWTVAELVKTYGPDPKKWAWGIAHVAYFPSLLDDLPGIEEKLTLGPYPTEAAGDSLNEAGANYRDGSQVKFTQVHGPSMRMIVEYTKNGPVGYMTNTLGQSMDPKDQFFKNQLPDWLGGKYHPALQDEKSIRKVLHQELLFGP